MSVVKWALALRAHPLFASLERSLRKLPPVNRLAKRSYANYKRRRLLEACNDESLRTTLLTGARLPNGFGRGMDERIVEYPWVFARLPSDAVCILDAGSTLNHDWIPGLPKIASAQVVVYTLDPEGTLDRLNYRYAYGDLRAIPFRAAFADAIVSISTIEHIGADHAEPTFQQAIGELRRTLKPGGTLLVTVPFGRDEQHGAWFRQFDNKRLDMLIAAFGETMAECDFFRHDELAGWQRATEAECAEARFIETRDANGQVLAAMATAIACLRFQRDDN